jgi:hypothetical protein
MRVVEKLKGTGMVMPSTGECKFVRGTQQCVRGSSPCIILSGDNHVPENRTARAL